MGGKLGRKEEEAVLMQLSQWVADGPEYRAIKETAAGKLNVDGGEYWVMGEVLK